MRNLLLAVVFSLCTLPIAHATGTPAFDGGAQSIDALLDQLLSALAAGDEHALHRLRVTEQEYRAVIIPGTVKPGQPARQVADRTSDYFWTMLNQKSEDVGRHLLLQFRGHQYTRKDLSFTKGTREFAGYTAYGDVRLQVADEHGETHEVRTGTIAAVGARFKFIGFNTNN